MTGQLRADAKRNRDQILAAARELLVNQGVGVPMEEIARHAGVGVGTLYRRFPDRVALLRALSVHTVEHMTDLARTALHTEPDAWNALSRFVRECVALRLGALRSIVDPQLHTALQHSEEVHSARMDLLGIVEQMIATAQRDGSMRTDVGVVDVAMLVSLHLKRPFDLPGTQPEEMDARLTQLMLDGLRPGSATPLPGKPANLSDVQWRTGR
ncbi:TetR/AcrR family transcriptional regulator [Kutzneria sp. CA-103260]|uniref:TetR/AcrR family transcriptional regulator n=1 Tax=Kutzneria sp. CA-103260 TaxID=2802641 RepID=UPI001BAB31EB|nr:TetR/AcrR family transcriptional regulator [Kutzneria sp. CA-103260]QUQ68127.1 TetR family transcriptional regulator [Kutzneria sp. CA-103260]